MTIRGMMVNVVRMDERRYCTEGYNHCQTQSFMTHEGGFVKENDAMLPDWGVVFRGEKCVPPGPGRVNWRVADGEEGGGGRVTETTIGGRKGARDSAPGTRGVILVRAVVPGLFLT